MASHHGVFRVDGQGGKEQIAGRTQDFMGFTIVGPNHFLASGHPGPHDDDQPSNLGLIESTDAAQNWTTLSLSGEADFHGMEAQHGRIYGYDSQSGQIMISTDMRTWIGEPASVSLTWPSLPTNPTRSSPPPNRALLAAPTVGERSRSSQTLRSSALSTGHRLDAYSVSPRTASCT